MNPDDFIHKYVDKRGQVWWIVAKDKGGYYEANRRPISARQSGCSKAYGSLDYLFENAYRFRSYQNALRLAEKTYLKST